MQCLQSLLRQLAPSRLLSYDSDSLFSICMGHIYDIKGGVLEMLLISDQ